MFVSSRVTGNYSSASPKHGAARGAGSGFKHRGKNRKYACPDVAGIQIELEEQTRLLALLLGFAPTAETAYSIPAPRGARFSDPSWLFMSSAHTSPAHLSVVGGAFLMESVVRYAALVRYLEFGGCPLFGSSKYIACKGIAVGTSTVVRYSEVHY